MIGEQFGFLTSSHRKCMVGRGGGVILHVLSPLMDSPHPICMSR
jgi:hypothetical protein